MKTYVAMLRGINLGARNRVAMEDLRALVLALPAEDAQTYVQSGNVVFRSRANASDVAAAIERNLRRELDLDVAVMLRTREQLAKVVARSPFVEAGIDPTKLHVTFLRDTPDARAIKKLRGTRFEPDELRVVRRDVYLHCPNGYGRSKLNNAFLEKQLGVAATTRNWRTVTTLAELAGA